MKKIISFLLFVFICFSVYSEKAYPGLISYVQPDGTIINYYLHGNENFSYMVSEDGFLLSYDDKGFLVDAEFDIVAKRMKVSSKNRTKLSAVESILDSIVVVLILFVYDSSNKIESAIVPLDKVYCNL